MREPAIKLELLPVRPIGKPVGGIQTGSGETPLESRKGIHLLVLALGLSFWGCGGEPGITPISDAHIMRPDAEQPIIYTITQLEPDHGPVTGGSLVTIRGFGFGDGSRIYFGSLMVDPDLTDYQGPNRIRVITPPGNVGPVDVRILRTDGESAELRGGFRYDAFHLDPPTGTMTGGTFVRVIGAGTDWSGDAEVLIDGEPLVDPTWVSPSLITGRTPANSPGPRPVSVVDGDDSVTVPEAFTYYDGADPINGGLGGGPIQGEVNITVLDGYTNEPVADAYVLMGSGPTSPYQAVTDASGRVSFSDPGLEGPQMVTVAAEDYERVSIIAFDARDVTVFLTPFVPPSSGTIPGQAWSLVQGLVSFGGVEFGQGCDFNQMLPDPGPDERRIIKMYQTVAYHSYVAAEPGESGIVVEGTSCISAYAYAIYARPGSYAVFALAGVENTTTRAFTPYAMGVVRNLLSGPNEVIQANILIDLQLVGQMSFDLSQAPPLSSEGGPVGYRIRLFIDLGGDGFLVRSDTQRSVVDTTEPVVIDRLSELSLGLSGGQYSAFMEAHNNGQYPYSKVYRTGLVSGLNPIVVSSWLGIPVAVDPPPGGVPSTNRLIWSAQGATPSFNIVSVRTFPDGDPYWRVYLHGQVTQFVLPDLFGLGPGLDGHPAGQMFWHVLPVTVDGMDFNNFSYRYLNERYWSATSGNGFLFSFPADAL